MSWESNKRIWDALLAVHKWLTIDFIGKINHGGEVTNDDWKPLLDAHQALKEEQFRLDTEIFSLTRKAIEESLYPALAQFVGTTNRQIQARDSGDRPLQQSLLEQMTQHYNGLVHDFEQQLHDIKAVSEKTLKESPRIHLPSLRHVGGGIMIDSPHATQDNRVIHAEEGAAVTSPMTTHTDRSTHITSAINNSPGAIANVAEHMAHVVNQVTQQVNESAVSDDVKQLLKQLAEQIAAIDVTANPTKVQQMAGDLKTLSDEVVKTEPRRKWYELSLEGIKEAAKAIGDIGKPVIETVTKLVPLLIP
jgi:flagellar biosynthesis/type III secretory pathway protein FliH